MKRKFNDANADESEVESIDSFSFSSSDDDIHAPAEAEASSSDSIPANQLEYQRDHHFETDDAYIERLENEELLRHCFISVTFRDDDARHPVMEQQEVLWQFTSSAQRMVRAARGYSSLVDDSPVSVDKRVSVYLGRPVTVSATSFSRAINSSDQITVKCVKVD